MCVCEEKGAAVFANFESVPLFLRQSHRWAVWRQQVDTKTTALKKCPYRLDLSRASKLIEPDGWGTLDEAFAALQKAGEKQSGIGLWLDRSDDLVCIDLDSCLEIVTEDGHKKLRIMSWAKPILGQCNSYTEISPSQLGCKIFVRSGLPVELGNGWWITRTKKHLPISAISPKKEASISIFQRGFLTVTGVRIRQLPSDVKSRDIRDMVLNIWRSNSSAVGVSQPERACNSSAAASSSTTTIVAPQTPRAAVARLRNCQGRPAQASDGSALLYWICIFCVDKWGYSDNQIHEVVHEYHLHEPLKMLAGGILRSDETIQRRIEDARRNLEKKSK